jgi:hypothetical protein
MEEKSQEETKSIQPMSEGEEVRILHPMSLTKRLSYVFDSLVRRVDAFDLLENRIAELEREIIAHEFPKEFDKKLDLYERYTRIHLSYIDALRKVVGQIDMQELARTAGLTSLFHKFQDMPPDSLKRINDLIDTIGEPTENE